MSYNYYEDQIKDVLQTPTDYPIQVKFVNGDTKTKYMNLNTESIDIIVYQLLDYKKTLGCKPPKKED